MSHRQSLAALRASGWSACWIFLNPPMSTPRAARERAQAALHALDRRARPPRPSADVEAERVVAAVVAAERAAAAVEALAWSSSCALDRDVILAPARGLAAEAAAVRAYLAHDDAALTAAAEQAAADHAVALAAARRAAGL